MNLGPVAWRTIPALACALTLAACGTVPSQVTAQTPASSSPPGSSSPTVSASPSPQSQACDASQLAITLTHTGALGGQAGGYLTFTNESGDTCRLTGWPTVVGVSKLGTTATLSHARSTMFGAWQFSSPMPVVDLPPGKSAYAVVAADDHPVGSAATCPAPYVKLRVTVPGSSGSTTLSAWLPGADSYLPTCTSITGKPTYVISDIVPRSSLPH
jgi:Domain of unknown function (DUF4232)